MKITNLLSLVLLAVPAAMALRGGATRRALAEDAASAPLTKRSLGGDYEWKKYEGACRKYKDGSGAGSDGREFERFYRNDYPDLDKDWCKDKCEKKGSDCTGFEYRDKGDKSHCEIWEYQIKGFDEDKDNHYCYVKEYEDDDDDDDDDECDDDYDHWEGACRKNSDGTNAGRRGHDYTRYYRKSKDWCKKECDDDENCTGYEWYYKHGKKHCEIWWSDIRGYKSSNYFDCYAKKG